MYPATNRIGLGVIGVTSLDLASEWASRGANLISRYGDQSQLPVWAEASGVDYVWAARTPDEIGTITNPLTPTMPILKPAMWWGAPSPWPSGGKSEPVQWGPLPNPDIELAKRFGERPRRSPLFIYDAGHKHWQHRHLIEQFTDVGVAAMYDQRDGWPPQFAAWSCQQSTKSFVGFVCVQVKGVRVIAPATHQRVRRNCWLAMAYGAKALMAYEIFNANDDTRDALGFTYREITTYEQFMLHGVRRIQADDAEVFPPWKIGPSLSIVSGVPKRITATWELGSETLSVRIDLERDTVSPDVRSRWMKPSAS